MANKGKCPRDTNICYPNMLTFSQTGRNLIISFEKHNYRKSQNLIYIQFLHFSQINKLGERETERTFESSQNQN